MADVYRVNYTSLIKVGSVGPNQMRTQTQDATVYVTASSEANAVAAVKAADPRNTNGNLEYTNFHVQKLMASIIVGS